MTKSRASGSCKADPAVEAKTTHQDAPSLPTKAPSKQECLASLLLRDEGATLAQMAAAMGWLPHTTRAAMTSLRKKGYVIDSDKVDGLRTYRAVSPK